jgi:ketosteroid isomerase-like protein
VSPADVARSYVESFAAGDPDAIAGHVAADFVNEHASALGQGCLGAEAYRARLPGFLAALPGLRYDVESVIADGNDVALAYRLTATSDGHPVDVRGVMVIEVEGDRIKRRTDYWDSLTFLRQTGQA